jgi:serine phosphatase RsbU (regulator of sigma subunit)
MAQPDQIPNHATMSLPIASLFAVLATLAGLHVLLASARLSLVEWLPPWVSTTIQLLDGFVSAAAVALLAWIVVRTSAPRELPRPERIVSWLRWSSLACIAVVAMPIPESESIGAAVLRILVGGAILAAAAWNTYVLLRIVRGYRVLQTPLLLRSIALLMVATLVVRWIEEIVGAGAFDAVYVFGGIAVSVIVFVLARRRRWLMLLPREVRRSIGKWSLATLLFATIACGTIFDRSSIHSQTLRSWLVGSDIVVGKLFLMTAVYAGVAFVTVLMARSATDRKTYEFDAITFFNRVVAEHAEPQRLYDTVTALAVALSDATAAWLLVYDKSSATWRMVSCAGISDHRAAALEIERNLSLNSMLEPLVVPNLRDDERFYRIARSVESYAQSLMVIPLREDDEPSGAVVVVSNKAYAFEHSDVESLAAFVPSVIIALANQRLLHTAIERERLRRELMLGREIQQRLLPATIPHLNGWEVVGWWEPAHEVGGDYFDYFRFADGTVCVLVADVSGKGIGAAFYMAKLKGICLASALVSQSLREFVIRIHRALDGVLEPRVYISLAAVGIRPDGTLSIIRAGHPPPIAVGNDGRTHLYLPRGIAIGLVPTEQFAAIIEEAVVEPRRFDRLVLVTDGVTEAGMVHDRELGIAGVREIIEQCCHATTATTMLDQIRSGLADRTGQALSADDMTLVVMRRLTSHDT